MYIYDDPDICQKYAYSYMNIAHHRENINISINGNDNNWKKLISDESKT